MKIIKFIILLLLLFSTFNFAQELYFCESYSEDGSPIGPINKLEIKPYGTAVYVLLESENEIHDPTLYMFMDKLINGKFTPYDSKTITIEGKKKWAVTSFEFNEPGIYEAYFLNSSQSRLATGKIEVNYSEEYSKNNYTKTIQSFGNSNMVFCELVINGKPVNRLNTLSIAQTDGQVFIYLNNHVPFGVDKIKLQVWKRSETDSNYEELFDSKKYRVLPEWTDTFFRYIFNSTGEFKFDIFDINDEFISSNIITVTK